MWNAKMDSTQTRGDSKMKRKNQKLRFSWPMCLGLLSCCMIVGCTLEDPLFGNVNHCGGSETVCTAEKMHSVAVECVD
jgi:hypothetical protein